MDNSLELETSEIGGKVNNDESTTPSSRLRFSWAEKMLIFQGQISKVKREMVDQQNEIISYTRELNRRKEALDQQMNTTGALFKEDYKTGMDAQRFG